VETDRTITQELADAFRAAIETYATWIRDGGHAPKVQVRRDLLDIESVCVLVSSFADLMPSGEHDRLCELAGRVGEGSMAPADYTYQSGAQCLRSLVEYRRSLKAPLAG
jgi:hypothetical protein